MSEALSIITSGKHQFFLAILDLNLPDAPDGEIVDLLFKHDIPSIIYSSTFDESLRAKVQNYNVIDYIIKQSCDSAENLVSLIQQLIKNTEISVLVVDDSSTSRLHLSRLLNQYMLQVYQATSGKEAMAILDEHPEIQLMMTDYIMPEMDGLELIRNVRRKRKKTEFGIIGMSAFGDPVLSSQFLKFGANDYINKPYFHEEFWCRISHTLGMLESFSRLEQAATHDHMTGLYNRRYLFEAADLLLSIAIRKNENLSLAMIDIDNFKQINDNYGHQCGDLIIQNIGSAFNDRLRSSDLAARFGGEEFCLIITESSKQDVICLLDEIREGIASRTILFGDQQVHVTVSIGIQGSPLDSIEQMIASADKALYQAKHNGKNQLAAF